MMNQFRRLMLVTFASGTVAGLVLFIVQHFTVIPLIETAETYEAASHDSISAVDQAHQNEEWHPVDGWQRTCVTALTTMLTAIGLAAIFFGLVALGGKPFDLRRGALWGLAAFACFGLAPALGLPPRPPGVAVADLSGRQLWWVATVIATAIGFWLIAGQQRAWRLRIGGLVCLSVPHLVGAPIATGDNVVPADLIRQFTIASLATSGIFWFLLGTLGGFIYNRTEVHSH
jgi:cobalt transporter subunit CbtA